MNKPILAIDIDDVSLDLIASLQPWHNRTYGTNLSLEDIHTFNLWEVWRCKKEEAYQRVYEYYASDDFLRVSPVEGAQEAISKLSRKFEIHAITGRPSFVEQQTRISMQQFFNDSISRIHITNDMGTSGLKTTKHRICNEIGAHALIEDAPKYALECVLGVPPVPVYLVSRPWNTPIRSHEGIISVNTISDTLSYLL